MEVTIFCIDVFSKNPQCKNQHLIDVKALSFERELQNVAKAGLDYTLSTDRTDINHGIKIITKTLIYVLP